jgi:hypothetical protein
VSFQSAHVQQTLRGDLPMLSSSGKGTFSMQSNALNPLNSFLMTIDNLLKIISYKHSRICTRTFYFILCYFLTLVQLSANSSLEQKVIAELIDKQHASLIVITKDPKQKISLPVTSIDTTEDRRLILKTLFSIVTKDEVTDQGRVEAWICYIQNRVAHFPKDAPLLENGMAIFDPYWILKNRMGHCGQINRVVVDGLAAMGFKTRVVQLVNHVAAEVWLDGAWRFLDADGLSFGQFVKHKDGTFASAEEIYKNPKLLDGLVPFIHFRMHGNRQNYQETLLLEYKECFSKKPYHYYKTATEEQEKNEYYGWNYYLTVK